MGNILVRCSRQEWGVICTNALLTYKLFTLVGHQDGLPKAVILTLENIGKKRSINYYRYHLVTTAVTLAVAPAWLLFTAGTQAFWLHTMRMPLASLTFAPSLQISSATCNEIHLRYQLKCKKINIYENIYFDDFEIWQSSHILFYLYKFEIHKIL